MEILSSVATGFNQVRRACIHNGYVIVACSENVATGSLLAYRRVEDTLVLAGSINEGNAYRSVSSDGTYIYAVHSSSGLRAYTFNGTTFTFINSISTFSGGGGYEEGDVYCSGGYIYFVGPTTTQGLRAYTFDGANFSFINRVAIGGGWLDVRGNIVYSAMYTSGLMVHSFNGATFTAIDSYYGGVGQITFCSVYNNYVFAYSSAGADEGVILFRFDGTNLTYLDRLSMPMDSAIALGVGDFVYLHRNMGQFDAIQIVNELITIRKSILIGVAAYDFAIISDGTYLYSGEDNAMHVISLCRHLPVAGFSISPQSGKAALRVQFTDSSTMEYI